MRGRNLKLFGILLLCILACSCRKKESPNELSPPVDDSMPRDMNNASAEENEPGELGKMAAGIQTKNKDDITADKGTEIKEAAVMSESEEVLAHAGDDYAAGSIVNTSELGREIIDSLFYEMELDQQLIDYITGKSYKEDADIPYEDLRYVRVLHVDFSGMTRVGELIVNKAIAQDVLDIFKELYELKYPIEKMYLIDKYDADDQASMADNNTSAFNYRLVEGTTRRSVHSYGLAIDINPLYNPYVRTKDGTQEVFPENAAKFTDRTKDNAYYIRKDDPCYSAFIKRGFTWGGEWKNSKDYQHFEKKLEN